jgi:hypothetical protein
MYGLVKHPTHIPLLLLSGLGCGQWPLHANLPTHDGGFISTRADPSSGIQIDWQLKREGPESSDVPGPPTSLSLGDGIQQTGTLDGSGWDLGISPAQWSDCGDPLAFPPDSPGGYTADVDWVTILTEDDVTLCTSVSLSDRSVSFDLTTYVLDGCGSPVEIFVDQDGPIGVARTGGRWSSQVIVPAGTQVGIALGAYHPDDPELRTDYTISVALVPPRTDLRLCPVVP